MSFYVISLLMLNYSPLHFELIVAYDILMTGGSWKITLILTVLRSEVNTIPLTPVKTMILSYHGTHATARIMKMRSPYEHPEETLL